MAEKHMKHAKWFPSWANPTFVLGKELPVCVHVIRSTRTAAGASARSHGLQGDAAWILAAAQLSWHVFFIWRSPPFAGERWTLALLNSKILIIFLPSNFANISIPLRNILISVFYHIKLFLMQSRLFSAIKSLYGSYPGFSPSLSVLL